MGLLFGISFLILISYWTQKDPRYTTPIKSFYKRKEAEIDEEIRQETRRENTAKVGEVLREDCNLPSCLVKLVFEFAESEDRTMEIWGQEIGSGVL